MPENVLSQPITTDDLQAIHQGIWIPRSTPLELSARSVENLRKRMSDEIVKVKVMFPDIPETRLDAAISVAYGYAGVLDIEALDRTSETTFYQKEAAARISHALAHSVIFASSPEASEEDKEVIASYLRLAQNLKNNRMLANSTMINEYWVGLQREIGVIRTLLAYGYDVYLPDYTQDPLEVPEEENEVLQFDVKSNVDIFALKNGKIILIDVTGLAKGQSQEKPAPAKLPQRIDIGFEWNPLLRKTLIDTNPSEAYRLVLGIPRQRDTFLPADFNDSRQTTDDALKNFGKLRGELSVDIKAILDSLKPTKVNQKFA